MTHDSLDSLTQQQQAAAAERRMERWNTAEQRRLKAAEQQFENNRNREVETMRWPTCGGEVKQQPEPDGEV